jgi:hypothetical protein
MIILHPLFIGVSVINLPKAERNSTGRDIMVMFADEGVSFRILATNEALNVMPIIGNTQLRGINIFAID